MPSKEAYYLEYNKDNIAKNLIQAEVHFRNIDPNVEPEVGFQNCILKHLLDAEGEAEEAISHSLVVEGEESAKKFTELRDKIRRLRKRMQKAWVPPEEGIKKIRELRRFFESFNPEYDISKCRSCGPIIEKGSQLLKPKSQQTESLIKPSNPTYKTDSTRVEGKGMKFDARMFAEDVIIGTITGTVGTALHFMAFQPYGDKSIPTFAGVKGGAILDFIAGIIMIAVSQLTEGIWKTLLLLTGGVLMGLGVAYAAGWIPSAPTAALRTPPLAIRPTPARATRSPATRATPATAPTGGITFQ